MNSFCQNCPRHCKAERTDSATLGFCNTPNDFFVSRIALHAWEEPCISGKEGSGTIFFSGCNLRCVYCQNKDISRGGVGNKMSEEELISAALDLQAQGANNINLVTPTHYAAQLVPLLQKLRPQLHVPVVYNCGGYEDVATLKKLEGLIDVYLPDCKYFDSDRAKKYSSAPDYFSRCKEALAEMLRQVGTPVFSDSGLLKSGMIVRHLLLPGGRKDSMKILQELASSFPKNSFLLSLMSQYTPDFAMTEPFPELHRRVTSFEYESVLALADSLGFDGFSQSRASATSKYTPRF